MNQSLLQILRLLRTPALVLLFYAIAHVIFEFLTKDGGLITPDGSVSVGVAIFGALVILFRIGLLFTLPALITYRLLAHTIRFPNPR